MSGCKCTCRWDNFWWGQIVQGTDLTRDTMSRDELRWSEKACLDRGRNRDIVYSVHMDSIDKYIRGYNSRLHTCTQSSRENQIEILTKQKFVKKGGEIHGKGKQLCRHTYNS
jgi:hypothetical protein